MRALNTVSHEVMVDLERVPGAHDVVGCEEDESAKGEVTEPLESLGCPHEHVLDLGGISSARGLKAYLLHWIRLFGALQTGRFNVRVTR